MLATLVSPAPGSYFECVAGVVIFYFYDDNGYSASYLCGIFLENAVGIQRATALDISRRIWLKYRERKVYIIISDGFITKKKDWISLALAEEQVETFLNARMSHD